MRLKNAFLYHLSEIKRPVLIFYGILFSIFILSFVLSVVYQDVRTQIAGVDFATAIFLFVMGCVTFNEIFPMLLQNSVSRKTMFKSRMAVALTAALFMSVVTALFTYGWREFLDVLPFMPSVSVFSVFQSVYFQAQDHSLAVILWSALLMFCINLFMYMIGMLLSLIFYRVNTLVKVLIAAGIPVLLIFVLPIVDAFFTKGQMLECFTHFINTVFGLSGREIWKGCVSLAVGSVLAGTASWLVMRRIPVKNKS